MANVKKGARRIKIVGLLTLLIAAVLFATFFMRFVPELFGHLLMNPNAVRTIVAAGFFLWALGWILQGFASRELIAANNLCIVALCYI